MFLKKIILAVLHAIRRVLTIINNHVLPKSVEKHYNQRWDLNYTNVEHKQAIDYYINDELKDSYNHFKQFFS